MTDEVVSHFPGVSSERLESLLAAGRASGGLNMHDVMDVFKDVDPTPDVIVGIKALLDQSGIAFEEDQPGEHELLDDGLPVSAAMSDVGNGVSATPGKVAAEPDGARGTSRERIDAARAARRAAMKGNESGADPVRMYLKEIGQVQLLTGPEEVAIATRIESGLLADEELALVAASQHPVHQSLDDPSSDGSDPDGESVAPIEPIELPPARRIELERLSADGHKAQSELTQANLRLVVSIAKRYAGRGMQLLDLVQEGNLGLMRAVEKFDHRKGFKFSTYATWWIRQAITRSIADQARTIRIPVHMVETMNRVKRVQRQMHQDLERNPTVEELAEECDLTPARIREILQISMDLLSLDSPVGAEDDSNLSDFIKDDRIEAPSDVAARRFLGEAVLEVLDELNEREQEVVRLRFGLDGNRPRTLEEVGKEFGVTRERIRQIEAKTLAKLRHPHRSEKLRGYLEES